MFEENVEPHLFIVFGATGDLMKRKLLPALHRLALQNNLGERFMILGIGLDEMDDSGYREWAAVALSESDSDVKTWCAERLHYATVGAADDTAYERIASTIEHIEAECDLPGNRTFYLALPPRAFAPTILGLGKAGLNRSKGFTRLVIEKPFGRDLATARALNEVLHTYFKESQIYRIDHYLGKETVQNLLVFRFANPVFESLWNRDRVESVEITVGESLGVETRASYYEKAGAMRDMIQNHLTQLMTLTAMEVPATFKADAIRDEKVKVLGSVAPLAPEDVIFGQYSEGHVGDEKVVGYLEEPGVAPDSRTETFAALRLQIDNWRWQGVPFYLRTGKRLDRRLTRIVVRFRSAPVALFKAYNSHTLQPNALILTLQPDEGFELFFEVKAPGQGVFTKTQKLHFQYNEAFGPLPDGYETLLHDIITNDQTLFVRADEVEMAWSLYEPMMTRDQPIHPYESGSWGPQEAYYLLAQSGHRWMDH